MNDVRATKFYIRHREGYPETEMQDYAMRGFHALNVETVPFYWVDDVDKMDDLGPEVGLSGYLGDVWAGMKKMGRPVPPYLDYPEEMREFLGRRVWASTLGEVRATTSQVFVKPVRQKDFTGFVWKADHESMRRTIPHPDHHPVWLSEPVEFVSEWRACILYRKLVGLQRYKGDMFKLPAKDTVEAGIRAMGRRAPHAYCVDWGVTSDGRTLMVEATESTSFGHYGLPPATYARMLAARWWQMATGRDE